MKRRQGHRYTKRLESTFAAEGFKFRGISSDISTGGLFIRTQHGFRPGTVIDIEIFASDNKISHVKGIVRRTVKTTLPTAKNGMGVQLLERDPVYSDILKEFGIPEAGERESEPEATNQDSTANKHQQATETEDLLSASRDKPESVILTCRNCNAKNRVMKNKLMLGPKCGKCGNPLDITGAV